MLPGLGAKTGGEIETVEKSRKKYRSDSRAAAKLPAAPAGMIDGEVIALPHLITRYQSKKRMENRLKAEPDETR